MLLEAEFKRYGGGVKEGSAILHSRVQEAGPEEVPRNHECWGLKSVYKSVRWTEGMQVQEGDMACTKA